MSLYTIGTDYNEPLGGAHAHRKLAAQKPDGFAALSLYAAVDDAMNGFRCARINSCNKVT